MTFKLNHPLDQNHNPSSAIINTNEEEEAEICPASSGKGGEPSPWASLSTKTECPTKKMVRIHHPSALVSNLYSIGWSICTAPSPFFPISSLRCICTIEIDDGDYIREREVDNGREKG
eukprot:TRINITY_DN5951_c1_g2_i1.p1 TRINITY_DN5951_c1_g2~~TRINITY_DN5951_c1_g2_i1.p1  ORF type:complete len:125 (+),score=21.48 TRINITY_DN5951_c1_g2_i1:24-377(+)